MPVLSLRWYFRKLRHTCAICGSDGGEYPTRRLWGRETGGFYLCRIHDHS